MKKLIIGMLIAVVTVTGVARAACGSCEAKPEGAKMTCPSKCVKGVTLTDEQKAKVDALQAKCKNGCPSGCAKACAAAMKEILTPEQQKKWQENLKACKKGKGGCPSAK
jgi:Spy/CpxP family protein refolding chaperone